MNNNSAGSYYTVYHATTKENAESILKSNQFRMPTQQHAIENGLKLGVGVYFGSNPGYSMDEALNSLLDAEPNLLSTNNNNLRKNNNKAEKKKLQNERLACLEVSVELRNGPNSEFSFGNYHQGQMGKKFWPLFHHHCMSATSPIEPLLPSGKVITDKPLSSREWDESTERLTPEYLQTYYGIDVLTINEDTDRQFELVLYELDCIVNIQEWNISSTAELN